METDPIVERRTVIDRRGDSSTGWVVAVLILLAVIIGGVIVWKKYGHTSAPAQSSGGTNINVTLPGGTTNTPSDNSGAAY